MEYSPLHEKVAIARERIIKPVVICVEKKNNVAVALEAITKLLNPGDR